MIKNFKYFKTDNVVIFFNESLNNLNESKARLLVTYDCDRACRGCCNKDWKFDKPIEVDLEDVYKYDTIYITGGEPMKYPDQLKKLVLDIKNNSDAKVILYTASPYPKKDFLDILNIIDGATITIHSFNDRKKFIEAGYNKMKFPNKSMRLNIFFRAGLDVDPLEWKIEYKKWIKDAPIPQGEDFIKLKKLISFNEHNRLDPYEFYLINESYDPKLYESKLIDTYKEVQKELKKTLGLQFYLVATFQMGVVALYPVVEALMKNSHIEVTKQQIVLLTIFSISQIAKVFNDDIRKIKSELEHDGIIHLVVEVKDDVLSVNRLFSFVARSLGKIVDVFTDMLGYLGLAIPTYMIVIEMISKDGLDLNTFPQKVAAIGVGVGTFTIKTVVKKVMDKIQKK